MGYAELLGDALLHALLLGHEFGIAAQQDVGSAARHVGSDGDHAFAAGLGDDFRFLLVILGVEHNVLNAFFLQQIRQALGLFDRSGAHQHWLASVIQLLNLVCGRKVFLFLSPIHQVRILNSQHLFIGGNDDHVELVDLPELGRFGVRGACHASQLLVHAEIILEGDGSEGLVLALDLHPFLGFDCLVKAVGPATSWHHAPGEFVHDNDFAIFDYVVHVATVNCVRLYRRLDVMLKVPVFRVSNVADPQKLLDFFPALVGDGSVAMLFVHHIVAGHGLRFARSTGD